MTSSSFDCASEVSHQNVVSGASSDRYSRVAIVLHWAIAAFIIFNLCTGFFMASWLAGRQRDTSADQMAVSDAARFIGPDRARAHRGAGRVEASQPPAAVSGNNEAVGTAHGPLRPLPALRGNGAHAAHRLGHSFGASAAGLPWRRRRCPLPGRRAPAGPPRVLKSGT